MKAAILFVVINTVYAIMDPPVGKVSVYNSIIPGRLRFPYEQEPSFYLIGYNAPVYEDFDAMFGAHVISSRKPENEFRLLLLGDSATWGVSVQAEDTLSEQINRLHLRTCDGRNIRAYNLGYPMPFLMRDALILDKAMEYQPDLVLWLVTLYTLEPKKAETYFILPHAERYQRLVSAYSLRSSKLAEPAKERGLWEQTIIGERRRLKKIMLTQMLGILWGATGIDNHEGLQQAGEMARADVAGNVDYEGWQPEESTQLLNSLSVDILAAAYQIAAPTPVVLVNEPIYIAEGKNHLIRYNTFYPRWAYDAYRQWLNDWVEKQDRPLLDYWDALPSAGFSDQNFHRSAFGEQQFAKLLGSEMSNLVCTQ